MQYQIGHADLKLILALVRGRTLARAAEQLQVDVSTVFRAIRKLEANLQVALFDKTRRGYTPTQSAKALAEQAERVCLITDTVQRAEDRARQTTNSLDLMFGVALPQPSATWDWEIAPFGEIGRRHCLVHRVYAYPDWRATRA